MSGQDLYRYSNDYLCCFIDLDKTSTDRDQSILAYSQYLAQTYQHQLQHDATGQIQAIIRRIDNGGYPKKELLTDSEYRHCGLCLAAGINLEKLAHLDELRVLVSAIWLIRSGHAGGRSALN